MWSEAWAWVRTAAMEVEVRVRRSWAEVWTRAEAQVWVAASGASVDLRYWWVARWICGLSGRMRRSVRRGRRYRDGRKGRGRRGRDYFWQGHWVRPRCGHRHWVGLGTLRCIRRLVDDQGHPIRPQSLWGRSHVIYGPTRPKRDEYSRLTYFVTPIINRLPLELLHRIFLIIEEIGGPPLVLMHVTRIVVFPP